MLGFESPVLQKEGNNKDFHHLEHEMVQDVSILHDTTTHQPKKCSWLERGSALTEISKKWSTADHFPPIKMKTYLKCQKTVNRSRWLRKYWKQTVLLISKDLWRGAELDWMTLMTVNKLKLTCIILVIGWTSNMHLVCGKVKLSLAPL